MRRTLPILAACLAVVVVLSLTQPVSAADDQTKFDRLDGWVHMINKDTATITLRVSPDIPRYVIYNDSTHFSYRNKPSSFEEVKEGRRVICLGTFDEKGRLIAKRIDVRVKN